MRFRPQVFLALIVLAFLGGYGIYSSGNEVASIAAAGVIALGKDVIMSDKD